MTSVDELIKEALAFEESQTSFKSRNDKIIASHKAKELILGLNEFYKESKDVAIMDIMKRITVIKQKVEKRLKMRLEA